MIFTGTFQRALDEKRRLAVPKRLREQMGGEDLRTLFVTPEPDHALGLWSPAAFERLTTRFEARSSARAEYRNYLRLFYARAEELELDAQNRVRIPDRLLDFAQVSREAVLLGVQDHVEVWDAGRWESVLAANGPNFDAMASQALT